MTGQKEKNKPGFVITWVRTMVCTKDHSNKNEGKVTEIEDKEQEVKYIGICLVVKLMQEKKWVGGAKFDFQVSYLDYKKNHINQGKEMENPSCT